MSNIGAASGNTWNQLSQAAGKNNGIWDGASTTAVKNDQAKYNKDVASGNITGAQADLEDAEVEADGRKGGGIGRANNSDGDKIGAKLDGMLTNGAINGGLHSQTPQHAESRNEFPREGERDRDFDSGEGGRNKGGNVTININEGHHHHREVEDDF